MASIIASIIAQKKEQILALINEKLEASSNKLAFHFDQSFGEVTKTVEDVENWINCSQPVIDHYLAVAQVCHGEAEEVIINNLKEDVPDVVLSAVENPASALELGSFDTSKDVVSAGNENGSEIMRMTSLEMPENTKETPDALILQGRQTINYSGQDVLVRFGLAWDFDSTVLLVVCLPKKESCKKNPFYGEIQVVLEFGDVSGNPVKFDFIAEPSNGTCSFPLEASDEEHSQCDTATHVEQVFQGLHELEAFKKELQSDGNVYFLTVAVKIVPLLSDDEQSAGFENCHVKAESQTSVEFEKENEGSGSIVAPVLVLPRFARVRDASPISWTEENCPVTNEDTGRVSTEETRPVSAEENLPKNELATKLSESARMAYESWLVGQGIGAWLDDMKVHGELLHFAHHSSLPKLVEDVVHNLDSTPDCKFTTDLAIDILAAGASYGLDAPGLLSRAGRFVLDNRCVA